MSKFDEFVAKNAMFTSIDIANSIKKNGAWVRNSEVAKWLRDNALSIAPSYNSVKIVVKNNHNASLYFPSNANPDDYKDRDQDALPPVQKTQTSQTHTQTVNLWSKILDGPKKVEIRCDKDARLRIPAELVKQLGWGPGDKVDKAKILVNQQDIHDDLVVHSDGRIAFPRHCVAWGDGPVLAFISQGSLCFEKPASH
jgi:hypothetical protein